MKTGVDENIFAFWKSFEVRGVDGVNLSLRLLDRSAWFQPSDLRRRVGLSRIFGLVLVRESIRSPESYFRIEESEVPGHHAHDGEWAAPDAYRLAHDRWICAIQLPPQSIAENDLLLV